MTVPVCVDDKAELDRLDGDEAIWRCPECMRAYIVTTDEMRERYETARKAFLKRPRLARG